MSTALTQAVARILLAPTLMIAVAILVNGYGDVGDGFSAGVVAALGVLAQYVVLGAREAERWLPVRLAPVFALGGLAIALLTAFVPLAFGDPLLTHAPSPGAKVVHLGTLELLTAVLFDVGVFLLVLGATVGIIHAIAAADEERP